MSERRAATTIEAKLVWTGWAPGGDFVSTACDRLELIYAGIPGDLHSGLYRKSGAREPWYERGTPMRNERQLSILSLDEMAEIAAALSIPELKPEWIGGNLLLSGVPSLSQLPPRSILMFPSGAAIRIDGDNGPCRHSGRAIAAQFPDRPDLEFGFVKAAKYKRGVLGWVEREGTISPGDNITIRVWEQALYPA
ncbi:MAG: MOSC domain-containing protein [Devosia sp.]